MRKSNTGTCNDMFRRFDVRNIFGNCLPAVAILLLSFLIGMTIPAYPFPEEPFKNLVDENRLISAPIELHLTSVEAPMNNSAVSLNHEDAWLFFDNIKPSVLLESDVLRLLDVSSLPAGLYVPKADGRLTSKYIKE